MLWSAVYGQIYATKWNEFEVDMRSDVPYEVQRDNWRRGCVVVASEEATLAVVATGNVVVDDVSTAAIGMLRRMLKP